jgi:hypothetical protein
MTCQLSLRLLHDDSVIHLFIDKVTNERQDPESRTVNSV